jgi:hypothetical protein
MTCITGRFSVHYTIVYLFSFAVCLLPNRLQPYNISGGHLISPFSRSSSNIFGDWIQLATLLPSFVLFGILLFILRLRSRSYGTSTLLFCLLCNDIKFCPLTIPTMAQIGCSWLWPRILFNWTSLPIPTAAYSLFFTLVCNCLLAILLKLDPYQYQQLKLHRGMEMVRIFFI